jgi:hypothetical protein
MIRFHWPAGRVYLPRDGLSTLQEEFTTQEVFTTLQEVHTILSKNSLPCNRSFITLRKCSLPWRKRFPSSERIRCLAATINHPKEWFTTLQEEFTTLGKGSLLCRSLPPLVRVRYPTSVYRPQGRFTTLEFTNRGAFPILQEFTTLGKGSLPVQ